ncbi:MAG: hypothetical protein ABSF36_00505 [Candidatus Methanomethylicaceae archaeon]
MSLNTTIRVELEGEIVDKFLELKQYLGLKNNAEVVRNCISICYASLFREGGSQTKDRIGRSPVRKKDEAIPSLRGGVKGG